MRLILFFWLLLLPVLAGAGPERSIFRWVTAKRGTVSRYGCFELGVGLDSLFANPYDYNEVALRCVFTGPGGRVDTVDGFFMTDCRIDTVTGKVLAAGRGDAGGHFAVRFAPTVAGRWTYRLFCDRESGRVWGPGGHFECKEGGDRGFVRTKGSPYVGFEDGSSFVPVGENLGWAQKNAYLDYKRWVGRLAQHGGDFIRVWMPAWGLGLEWRKGWGGYQGLGRYQQSNAAVLDWLFEYCREKGVYMLLSLDHHGQVSTKVNPNWSENPYNLANGGPCEHTWDFFTDAKARGLIRNRFRYIVARWGYSDHLMAWELFNEVDWTDEFRTRHGDVAQWHAEMAAWLRGLDVNRHLITTSFGDARWDSLVWRLPSMDFTQTHYYISTSLDNVLGAGTAKYLAAYRKPTLNGEFGLAVDDRGLAAVDSTGVYVHNALWATLLSGGMGAGLSWWWDNYIDARNLYGCFDGVARFAAKVDFRGFMPARVSVDGAGVGARAYALRSGDSSRVAGWVLNPRYREPGAAVDGAVISMAGMADGKYAVRWWDCQKGVVDIVDTVMVESGVLRASCPSVSWDRAMTAERISGALSGISKGSSRSGE